MEPIFRELLKFGSLSVNYHYNADIFYNASAGGPANHMGNLDTKQWIKSFKELWNKSFHK